jgi:hypothetical protein
MDPSIHLCFVSQDPGFAEVIGRALGDGFTSRVCDEFALGRINETRDWCDVVARIAHYSWA